MTTVITTQKKDHPAANLAAQAGRPVETNTLETSMSIHTNVTGQSVASAGPVRDVDLPELREFLLTNEFGLTLKDVLFRGSEALYLEGVELLIKRHDELGDVDAFWTWARSLVPAAHTDKADTVLPLILAVRWCFRRADGWAEADLNADGAPPVNGGVR